MQTLNRQEFIALLSIVFLALGGLLGIDIHLASMPYIMTDLGTDQTVMQQSITLFLFGLGVSQLFYGPISDVVGRKPVVIFGVIVAGAASFLACFSQSIASFLCYRFLQGLGSSALMGMGRTMIADLYQGERLSSLASYFTMILVLSPMVAPALGGIIEEYYDWQMNFAVLGGYIVLSGLFFYFCCPETNQHKQAESLRLKIVFNRYIGLMKHPDLILCSALAGFAMAANMTYATLSPFIFKTQFALSPQDYGVVTALAGSGALLGKLINPLLIRKVGGRRTLFLGVIILLLAFLWLLFIYFINAMVIPLVMGAVFASILSQALVTPNAMAYGLSPFHRQRGMASAIYGSVMLAISFSVTSLVSAFNGYGLLTLMVVYGILGIVSLLNFILLNHTKD